ncbi:MAG: phage regulatory protein/antirepressor Ant [Prevotella sp.]|nr:phage regulatory protein/antirepressor Ant [Prevotella sp.]
MANLEILEITAIGAAQNMQAGLTGEQNGEQNGEQENVKDGEPRMTSIEIAEVTGKQHKDVMKAIRNMEPAWEKITWRKFAPRERTIEYPNGSVKKYPYYLLTKTECLYIATKFNDEARARLVLRWKKLEEAQRRQVRQQSQPMTDFEIMCKALEIQQQTIKMQGRKICEMAPKALYSDKVLDSIDCYTMTQVAKELSMTVYDLTKWLIQHGIIYHQSGQYMLYAEYARKGYGKTRTHSYTDSQGAVHTNIYLVWTEAGRKFLHSIIHA